MIMIGHKVHSCTGEEGGREQSSACESTVSPATPTSPCLVSFGNGAANRLHKNWWFGKCLREIEFCKQASASGNW